MARSDLGGLTIDATCHLRAARLTALDLTNSTIGSSVTIGPGSVRVAHDQQLPTPVMTLEGSLLLSNARVDGALTLARTRWVSPQEVNVSHGVRSNCIYGVGLTVRGDLNLEGATFDGSLNFRSGRLATIEASGVAVSNASGTYALNLNGAVVTGNLQLCAGFACSGQLRLDRAQVAGMINLDGSRLSGRVVDNSTLTARDTTVVGTITLDWASCSGTITLSQLSAATVLDVPSRWPDGFDIAGMTYTRLTAISPRLTLGSEVKQRQAWLGMLTPFDLGPYHVLAADYTRRGHRRKAQQILMSGYRESRRAGLRSATGWSKAGAGVVRVLLWPVDFLTGYGYRPERAAGALLAFILATLIVVSFPANLQTLRTTDAASEVYSPYGPIAATLDAPTGEPTIACSGGKVRCFRAPEFAVDTVVPLVSFGQGNTWYTNDETARGHDLGTFFAVLRALGWFVTSIFALSFARFVRD